MTVDASPDARPRAAGMLRLYRALWARCPGERPWFVAAIVLLFGSQLVKLGVPAVAARAIDVLQQQGAAGLGEAGLWLLALFGATLASWALHGPGRLLERRVALTVRTRESAALVSDVFSLPLAWHEQHHSAATVHRIEQSNRALYDFAQSQFVVLQNAVRLVGPVAALWLIDARVGAAALAGLLVISLSITGFDRAMLRLAREENEAERRHAATLVDAVGHVTTVLALRQTEGVAALIARRLQAIYRPLGRMIVVNEAKWCSVDLLAQGLSCALLALYAVLATRPSAPGAAVPALALGTLYMVWEYALQAGGVISSVAAHFQTFVRQQADHASADPIREAAAARAAPPPAAAPAAGWRRLRIEELGYRYAARSHGLDRVTLTLQRGRRYALVGASGSGKSTLLKLLAGLVAADRIRVVAEPGDAPGAADVDIADPAAAAAWLRSAATLVPQDAEVFEGSLAENLALGRTLAGTAPAGGPAPALRIACADDFVDVAGDLDAVRIAERGGNWSGGQRQRVALARGVLAAERSPLLLLDEPTASLDPQTEERVHERLFAAFGDAAIVASVHRPHLLARFDEVLWMDGGRLVGQMPAARYLAHRGPTGDAPPVA